MSPRKSPYKHPVNSHVRSGKPVTNYVRGKGDQVIKPRSSRVVGDNPSSSPYDVTVNYVSSSEKIHVDAKDNVRAFDSGMVSREKTDTPMSVKIRMVN